MAGSLDWIAHSGVVQGIIIGGVLAFLTATAVMDVVIRAITTTANGWHAIRVCGQPDNGPLVRSASAKALPLVNVFEEAAYWTATKDGAGRALRGAGRYVLSFPAGGLPPVGAFWSLTVTDTAGYMQRNAIGRSSLDDLSDLERNADGTIDIRLQHEVPLGHERNWLPVPAGRFKLTLRAYLPGAAILDGRYRVPPIVKAA